MAVSGYKFAEFEVDRARFQLRRKGTPLKLEPIPLELLLLLVEREGNVVGRQEIAERLWGKDVFLDTEHGINTAVRKVRQVLGDDPEDPHFVETVSGKGYRFIALATELEATNGNGSHTFQTTAPKTIPSPSEPAVPPPVQIATAVSDRPRITTPARWLVTVSIAAGSILLFGWFRPPIPAPKILRTTQLTSDGREKFVRIVTDGLRIYTSERIGDHWKIVAIPISGEEATPLSLPFLDAQVMDVSPDHSALLIKDYPPIAPHAIWRVPILGGSPRRLGNFEAQDASWSPDGRWLAYMTGPDLYLAKADGTEARKIELPHPDPHIWVWSAVWSPDGTRLRFERYSMDTHKSALWEASGTGENPHELFPGWQKTPMQCCGTWSPGGKYYVFDAWEELQGGAPIAPAPNLWVVREQSNWLRKVNKQPLQVTSGPMHFFDQLLSSDGKTIFTMSTQRRGELARYDAKLGKFLPYLPGFSAGAVSFSPSGEWMAYIKFPQGELWRSRPDGSAALQLTFRPMMADAPRWSPDSTQIVFVGQQPGARSSYYIIRPDGSAPQALPFTSHDEASASWSPDGEALIFPHNSQPVEGIGRFDLKSRNVSVLPDSAGMLNPLWSPDGRQVCAVQERGYDLMLFDVKSERWTTLVKSGVHEAVWSSHGESIYYITWGPDSSIFRWDLHRARPKKIADLKDVQVVDTRGPSLALTPNDEPLVLRENGSEMEVYALDWDAP